MVVDILIRFGDEPGEVRRCGLQRLPEPLPQSDQALVSIGRRCPHDCNSGVDLLQPPDFPRLRHSDGALRSKILAYPINGLHEIHHFLHHIEPPERLDSKETPVSQCILQLGSDAFLVSVKPFISQQ